MDQERKLMIQVENLHKYFGALHVIKGISTNIYKREVVSVMGPSGGGKSTFLRCINRLRRANFWKNIH